MKPETLGTLAFFNGISTNDLALLAPFFTPRSFPTASTVFEQGDRSSYLYLVVKGSVVIRYKPEDGPVMTVAHVLPGDVFGWSAAMSNPFYTSGAVCEEDTSTVRILGKDLQRLCEKHPALGKIILERLTAVIAERKRTCKFDVTLMLENNLRHTAENAGEQSMAQSDPKAEIQMKALVEQLSAYIETFHGGSAEYVSFDGRVLKVHLGGACLGCPLSPSTLHGWVEGTVRQFFPDIEQVESV